MREHVTDIWDHWQEQGFPWQFAGQSSTPTASMFLRNWNATLAIQDDQTNRQKPIGLPTGGLAV
jgi:hypothetical protein